MSGERLEVMWRRSTKFLQSLAEMLMRVPSGWRSICVNIAENYPFICPMLFMAETR